MEDSKGKCSNCTDVLVPGENISKKQFKNTILRGRQGTCQKCQTVEPTAKAQKTIKGKTRCRIILPGQKISIAEDPETCKIAADTIAKTISPGKKVLFMDLHNTFDLLIEYAKRGEKEMVEVKELLNLNQNELEIVIVTFVGWNNKTTELAITDIHWAIEHLGVKSGVVVSERNHSGTTPETQTFIGGKGWIIDLITKSEIFPKTKCYFTDDSDDHLLSVMSMCPDTVSEVVKCTDIDQLWRWTLSLKKK